MEKKKVMRTLIIGVVASLIAVVIVAIFRYFAAPQVWSVQIMSINEGQNVTIDSKTLEEKPNQDGVLFVYATGDTKEYSGKLVVEVQPKDEENWYKQGDAEAKGGGYAARVQLGSQEWPIRGGEQYILRVSAGQVSARAMITISPGEEGAL